MDLKSTLKVRSKTSNKSRRSTRDTKENLTDIFHESEPSIQSNVEEIDSFVIVNTALCGIIDTVLEITYEKYLQKQTVYFVSHCSRLAWKSLIEWNYQRKDKGGLRESVKDDLDMEPQPSPKDTWASHNIPIAKKDQLNMSQTKDESKQTTIHSANDNVNENAGNTLEETPHAPDQQDRTATLIRMRKHHPKTSKKQKPEDLPATIPGRSRKTIDFKESYELPSPVPMQYKNFPSSRVDVQYSITPGVRGCVTNKAPKSKTIRLENKRDLEK